MRWVNDDRKFLQWRSRLVPLLDAYDRDRKAARLRGIAVREASQFYPSRKAELDHQEQVFVSDSIKAEWRRQLGFWGGLVAVAVVLCGSFVGVRTYVRQQSIKIKVADAVEDLPRSASLDVPQELVTLSLSRSYAATLLDIAYRKEDDTHYKLRLAFGLLMTRKVDHVSHDVATFIVDHIPHVRADDSASLVQSLAKIDDQNSVIERLLTKADASTDDSARTRYHVTALSLGGVARVEKICKLKAVPRDRAEFIGGFSALPGSLKRIADLLKENEDPDLRSALCAALGTVDLRSRSSEERKAIVAEIARLYQEAKETGVHAAARWTLKKWEDDLEVDLPAIKKCNSETEQTKWSEHHDWFVNSQEMTMLRIAIASRKFEMGSKDGEYDEDPIHTVHIAEFWISDREVSVAQFEALTRENEGEEETAANAETLRLHRPMSSVTWFDAVEFCNKLSDSDQLDQHYYELKNEVREGGRLIAADVTVLGGNGYRLPTEAEWEYACRAKSTTQFSCGNGETWLHAYAVLGTVAKDCGSKMPNGWGLFDMHGNVWEWCWDWYGDDYYRESPEKDPLGPSTGSFRVYRGGSWIFDAMDSRSAYRYGFDPVLRFSDLGFRLARSSSGK